MLRPVLGERGTLWVMDRDIYWLGAQQATHVLKVLDAERGHEDLTLHTNHGDFLVEFPGPEDLAEIRAFRRYAAQPDSGYAEGEKIQAEALVAFVDEMEAGGA